MPKSEKRFFTDDDNETLIYFKLPKVLMVAKKYEKMSNDAKLLYAYYLNLNTLSMKRGWKDEEGHYYIKFKDANAMAMIRCASQKFTNLKKELVKFGLVHIVKTGQGKTNKTYVLKLEYTSEDVYKSNEIFESVADDADEADAQADLRKSKVSTESSDLRKSKVKDDSTDFRKSKVLAFENQKSRVLKIKKLDFRKSKTINKNYSTKTDFRENDFNSSSSQIFKTDGANNLKNMEEEELQGITYNLQILGKRIAEENLMLTNRQVTDAVNLVVERGLIHFDELDIENTIAHYKTECVKRKIISPPLFFVNGLEMMMSARYTYAIGSTERAEIERIKGLKEHVPKVEFYNWLEERD